MHKKGTSTEVKKVAYTEIDFKHVTLDSTPKNFISPSGNYYISRNLIWNYKIDDTLMIFYY